MKEQVTKHILQQMMPYLDNTQLKQLEKTLQVCLQPVRVEMHSQPETLEPNENLLTKFLDAKRVEGCSSRTL